jgi:hypothetical protein
VRVHLQDKVGWQNLAAWIYKKKKNTKTGDSVAKIKKLWANKTE